MRKFCLLVLVAYFAIGICSAQHHFVPFVAANHNPGSINTEFEGTYPIGGWTNLLFGSNQTPKWSTARSLPFPITFNGKTFTKFRACSNGIVTFDTTEILPVAPYGRLLLPHDSVPDHSLCLTGIAGTAGKDYLIYKIFGTAPNRQCWIHFNSYGFSESPSTDSTATFWSIVLEETTSSIYFVDQRTDGYEDSLRRVSIGIQYTKSQAVNLEGSPNIPVLATALRYAKDNSYYEARIGPRPKFDLAMQRITSDTFVAIENQLITGVLQNNGSQVVDRFDLNFRINGGKIITASLTGLSIPTSGTYAFTHPTPWVVTQKGAYFVEVWASNINGQVDEFTADDRLSKNIIVFSKNIQKAPLFELFTSSTAPACLLGNQNFQNIVAGKPQKDYVFISYPNSDPDDGDPYWTREVPTRKTYYQYYVPQMSINGGWDSTSLNLNEATYQRARLQRAGFDLEGKYTFDPITKTIKAKVSYSPLFDADNYTLHVAIVEKQTTKNARTNGETIFRNVLKKMLPNETGTPLKSALEGTKDSLSLEFTFYGDYRLPTGYTPANPIDFTKEHSVEDFNNLEVIAWVQGVGKEVQQALTLTKVQTAVSDLLDHFNFNVFPNPVVNQLNVQFNSMTDDHLEINLYQLDGKIIKSMAISVKSGLNNFLVDLSEIPSGPYYLSISNKENKVTSRPLWVLKK